ncbi:hypothetical protein [Latilactobacillus sakei]|uniref:hypothetical protein n=1 Tax=Latilactobacillus sakei TaxID=1599 RepID=UPI003F530E5F
MKKLCILVYQGLPFLIDNLVIFNKKERNFVKKLNNRIDELSMSWQVELDSSIGNISDIEAKNPRALLLKNGLQYRFNTGGFSKNDIYQLGALELQEGDIDGVISFLKHLNR